MKYRYQAPLCWKYFLLLHKLNKKNTEFDCSQEECLDYLTHLWWSSDAYWWSLRWNHLMKANGATINPLNQTYIGEVIKSLFIWYWLKELNALLWSARIKFFFVYSNNQLSQNVYNLQPTRQESVRQTDWTHFVGMFMTNAQFANQVDRSAWNIVHHRTRSWSWVSSRWMWSWLVIFR